MSRIIERSHHSWLKLRLLHLLHPSGPAPALLASPAASRSIAPGSGSGLSRNPPSIPNSPRANADEEERVLKTSSTSSTNLFCCSCLLFEFVSLFPRNGGSPANFPHITFPYLQVVAVAPSVCAGGGTMGAATANGHAENGVFAKHSVCLVLDYGSQYTQLIARRIRENGVLSMLLPGDASLVSPISIKQQPTTNHLLRQVPPNPSTPSSLITASPLPS
jgi:hypothetical protein